MLLGLDLGTTNVKVIVTSREGRTIARGSRPVSLIRLPDGGVEQELEEIWQATLGALADVLREVEPAKISAMGISSQGGAMQLLDAAGQPRGRVVSWLDQRGRSFDEALTAELGRDWFVKRIAHRGSWLTVGQILRLQKVDRASCAPPNRIGFVGDIIVSRLCGRPVHDGTSAGLTLLYNPELRVYDPELLARLGLASGQLPELRLVREPAGCLNTGLARSLGLPQGLKVSAAVHDQYASALATGAVRKGTVMVGTGTAWVLLAIGDRLPLPVIDSAFVCHHVVDGLYGQILSMVNGGSALSWALELTGVREPKSETIDQLLEAGPPGSEGVGFWPFMTPFGASGLAPGARGCLSGLQLSHRGTHLIRAVLEGLAYELNRHLDFLRQIGQPLEQLVLGGGAASSRVTPQLLADACGLPLRCFSGSESSVLGAAILARGLLEPQVSLAQLAEAMMPPSVSIEPGPNAGFYRDAYQKYLASLPLLRPDQS